MFQQIILLGNLGNDPEMRYTPSGVPVTSFSLAVNRRWTGQDGQQQEKTTWFRVTAWRKTAELASQYLTKGRQVLVVGELEEARTYTDRNGNTQVSIEVTAQNLKFIGTRGEGGAPGGGYSGGQQAEPMPSGGMTEEDIPF